MSGLLVALGLSAVFISVQCLPRGAYDETVAREYLKFVNAQDAAFNNEYSIAEWGYESNITDENLEISVRTHT